MKNSSARVLDPTTVPPPAGATDVYSAQTRLGSLPEDVLEAMRAEEHDVRYLRTRSGTQRAVRPPPVPRAESVHPAPARPETPEPFSSVRPRSLPPPVGEMEAISEIDLALDEPAAIPTSSFEIVVEEGPEARSSLVRSVMIVALFAVLGGLAACAIMLLD